MFKKPFTAMKKFFTFKLPGKKGVLLPNKTNLKPLTQKELDDAELREKRLKKIRHRTHTKLMQQQKRVKKWRSPWQSGIKAGLRPGHEHIRDRETNRLRRVAHMEKAARSAL